MNTLRAQTRWATRTRHAAWRWTGVALVAAAVAVLLPAIASAQTPAATTRWSATAIGANEVPATTSTATGAFTATLDEAAGTLTWTLSVPAITNATAAHLHPGATGVNGSVTLPLFAAPTGAPTASINASGVARVADLAGPLAGNFAGFVTALKAGGLYVNVHTSANAGGEIRAQVVAATTAAAAPAAAAPAASPAPSKTGNAGLVGMGASTSPFAVGLLLVLAVAVVTAGRVVTREAGRR